ncbi:MAG TPA: SGNH/GDSL hydrolase family protein [Burkholderiales bacterium]|nr:SGNH/GDSL hydrolase family protein [Burkholderiales bacterium]
MQRGVSGEGAVMLSFLAKPWLFSIVLAFALLAPDRAFADDRFGRHRPIDRIVVFGDSLSDPGNAYEFYGKQPPIAPPDYGMAGVDSQGIPEVIALIPDPKAPYASRRFSNGVTWIELLGGAIGLGSSVKPAFAGSDRRAFNYAVAGARAGGAGPVDLSRQVGLFLDDVRGRADDDALYVIEIGGNDIRDALEALLTGGNPGEVIEAAVGSVGYNIAKLYRAGARKFLIWNVPNVGRTPALQRLSTFVAPVFAPAATALVVGEDGNGGYNGGLKALLHFLSTAPASAGGLPGIEIVQFDAFASLEAVQQNPQSFGLLDASTACIQPDVPHFGFPSAPPHRCEHPDRHFFWDGIHPTRVGHAIMAFLVGKKLVHALHD